jgi:lipopolysaccharide transport system ATP-binding protein
MTSTLEFIDVSKQYRLGGFHGSLREAIPSLVRRWTGREAAPAPDLWALRHVSFRAGQGEALAIIGPNGAGKTTTLKLATAVTQPTSGRISVRGRTSALIELGAGFHPDLTGRENIYLNGTILGLKRSEIRQRFDAIVEFSELEAFLDTPVKRYSSGMYARLGFAVAAHVNPEVLFVDEVLAVGDLAFQAKCLAHMAEMKRAGTTVVIVSHQLPRVRRLCDRGLFLYRGQVLADGPIDEAITFYQDNPAYASNLRVERPLAGGADLGSDARPVSSLSADSPIAISAVSLLSDSDQRVSTCQTGDRLVVRIAFAALRPVESPVFEVWIHSADGTEYAAFTTKWDGFLCDGSPGSGHVDLVLDPLCLLSGRYLLSVAITASDGVSRHDWHWQRYGLDVRAGRYLQGLVYLPHTWASARDEPVPAAAPPGVPGDSRLSE